MTDKYDFIYVVLCCLTLATMLNLWITIRLARAVQDFGPEDDVELSIPVGASLPILNVTRSKLTGEKFRLEGLGKSFVLLFLSSGCPACKRIAEEVSELFPAFDRANVDIWIVTLGPEASIVEIFEAKIVDRIFVTLSAEDLQSLNPKSAAPFYIFVNSENTIEASNFAGDENWHMFLDQIKDSSDAS